MINGITLNTLWFNSINFQPSISSVQEFKVDNSTFSAEYGQNSGAVVNIATRSGANEFHGELFEFLRNDALDARNFFNFTSSEPPPFKRNLFGGNLGGPIVKNRTFFLFSYEGMRHRQGLDLNSLVLSDAERASTTDPVIAKLIELVPRANFVDSSGTPRFIGSATAPVNADHWTIDISHNLGQKDRLHGYYAVQRRDFLEPSRDGNTIPGFGNTHHSFRQFFSLNETHVFGSAMVNEARLASIAFTLTPNRRPNSIRPTLAYLTASASPSDCRRSTLPAASTSVDHPPTRRGVLTRCSSSQIPRATLSGDTRSSSAVSSDSFSTTFSGVARAFSIFRPSPPSSTARRTLSA